MRRKNTAPITVVVTHSKDPELGSLLSFTSRSFMGHAIALLRFANAVKSVDPHHRIDCELVGTTITIRRLRILPDAVPLTLDEVSAALRAAVQSQGLNWELKFREVTDPIATEDPRAQVQPTRPSADRRQARLKPVPTPQPAAPRQEPERPRREQPARQRPEAVQRPAPSPAQPQQPERRLHAVPSPQPATPPRQPSQGSGWKVPRRSHGVRVSLAYSRLPSARNDIAYPAIGLNGPRSEDGIELRRLCAAADYEVTSSGYGATVIVMKQLAVGDSAKREAHRVLMAFVEELALHFNWRLSLER